MRVLLLSTYELGRQPFGLASPAAWLQEAGIEVACADLTRQPLPEAEVTAADLVAVYLPMHTATRLALPTLERVRARNPAAHLCCYGLYAPLNGPVLRNHGVQTVLGGEFEEALTSLAIALRNGLDPAAAGSSGHADTRSSDLPRLRFRVPDRRGLPRLDRYASLQIGDERRVVGYTEASRGCKHLCRHCPVVPVYQGRFRLVDVSVVLADIRAQVAAGAEHITFGDPDFFNGIRHALRLVEGVAREFPRLTYDVTIKIEHLLQHARHLPILRDTGCLFVTSAVESIDDRVLGLLDKGHTRADFEQAVGICRETGLPLAPTFVAFTPWISMEGYCELLDTIEALDLVDHVAPIQLAIRLLVMEGSRLLELPEVRGLIGPFRPETLAYDWTHPDPRVDGLQQEVMALVGRRVNAPRQAIFAAVSTIARERAGAPRAEPRPVRPRAAVPYLNEPWYC